jgi:hypothetical protein
MLIPAVCLSAMDTNGPPFLVVDSYQLSVYHGYLSYHFYVDWAHGELSCWAHWELYFTLASLDKTQLVASQNTFEDERQWAQILSRLGETWKLESFGDSDG